MGGTRSREFGILEAPRSPVRGDRTPAGRPSGPGAAPVAMTLPPVVLLCAHDPAPADDLVERLEALGFRVDVSRFLRESVERLRAHRPDLIVLRPLARGGRAELAVLDRLRRGEPQVPLLIVGEGGLGPAGASLRDLVGCGPWDAIAGDAAADEWRLRIERLEVELERNARIRALEHTASHDGLTNLLRKNSFQDRLEEHFSAAQRHRFDMALVLIDLDDFGLVNKRHDHVVGDNLIRDVGEVIRNALRAEDVAGRLGGDEFGVLLPYTAKLDAAAVVNRLRDAIRELSGRPPGARSEIRVASSIGFETFDGTDLDSVEGLRLHAERALREAKRRGGDQGVYFRSLADAGASPAPVDGGAADGSGAAPGDGPEDAGA